MMYGSCTALFDTLASCIKNILSFFYHHTEAIFSRISFLDFFSWHVPWQD